MRQAGSTSNEIAKAAVDEMRKRKWLRVDDNEQLLKGADLPGTNLKGARLTYAKLKSATLWGVKCDEKHRTAIGSG